MTQYDEDETKFYVQHSISMVGYRDTIETGTSGQHGANSADQFIEKLARDFHEGVERMMQNKREHGHHPISAWNHAIKEDWPDWVKVKLAESQHHIFTSGSVEFRDQKETEYIEYLEDEYEVPR